MSFKNIVFEGGGIQALAYCGVIEEFERQQITIPKNLAGSSAGAFFAMLLALDFNSHEIKEIVSKYAREDIFNTNILKKIYNLIFHWGFIKTHTLKSMLKQIIQKKYDPNITFGQLYDKSQKNLIIVVSCVNTRKPIYLNAFQYPDIKISDAIIASITIPVIFTPSQNLLGNQYLYVDGGLLDNYPLWIFNDLSFKYNPNNSISKQTLGVKLINNQDYISHPSDNLFKYVYNIIYSLMLRIEQLPISSSYLKQTIPIEVPSISIINFQIPQDTRELLYKLGSKSTQNFLSTYNK